MATAAMGISISSTIPLVLLHILISILTMHRTRKNSFFCGGFGEMFEETDPKLILTHFPQTFLTNPSKLRIL